MTLNEAILATVLAEAAAQGLTMRDLADRSGLAYDTWRNHYGKMKRPLNTDRIVQLAAGLGMSDEQLLELAFERKRRNEAEGSK